VQPTSGHIRGGSRATPIQDGGGHVASPCAKGGVRATLDLVGAISGTPFLFSFFLETKFKFLIFYIVYIYIFNILMFFF
jgi:hypothetical protein